MTAHGDNIECIRGMTYIPSMSLLYDCYSPDGCRRLVELTRYVIARSNVVDLEAKRAARKHLRERTL
jgi:hypothetical protein